MATPPTEHAVIGEVCDYGRTEGYRRRGLGRAAVLEGIRLGVAERTVKAHLTNIYNKLGVETRAEAIAVAMQRGILPHSTA